MKFFFKKINLVKLGYKILLKNIFEFVKINEMFIFFDICWVDEGGGIEVVLIKNEVKYYELCRL